MANPYVVLLIAVVAVLANIQKLLSTFNSKQIMSFTQFLLEVNWLNLIVQFCMLYAIYFLAKENKKKQESITALKEIFANEITNDIYPRLIKYDYRISRLITQRPYNDAEERDAVREYFESDTHGLTVEQAKKLLDKHCPMLPNIV